MEDARVGPFKIVRRLGTNRRQRVFHAQQVEQNKDVVLKFIKLPPDIPWDSAVSKIEREVTLLKRLRHEHLIQVFGAGVHEEQVFFASELFPSESLTSVLSRRGRLASDLAVEYGRQIALALEYLHEEEILHSKLTPDKILISPDHKVKVSDVRLNRSRKRRWDDTARRRELDIAAYMAPEQFTEGATAKSDFYALGVLMFEMLTGKLPYPPDTMGRMTQKKMNSPIPSVADHVMDCPLWLDQLVRQLLDPNPRKRPHTAKAIVFAFDELKNIDKTKKAAVAQVSGGFNQLTVGADKTEARRLLGKKNPRFEEKSSGPPFYQTIPFLVVALLLIAVVIGLALVPPKPETLMRRGNALMESDKVSAWREARSLFKKVMDNERAPQEMRAEAEEQYFETRRRTLVVQAESGTVLLYQDKEYQMFGKAVAAEMEGELSKARRLYTELVSSIDPGGDQRHILAESKTRLTRLSARIELPNTAEELMQLVQSTSSRDEWTPESIEAAEKLLSRIVLKFTGEEGFEPVVQEAQSVLNTIEDVKVDEGSSPIQDQANEGAADSNEATTGQGTDNRNDADQADSNSFE